MRFLIVAAIALCLAGPAGLVSSASAFRDSDRNEVQSVIEGQLNAFLADDGATAYSFAAPNIKQLFPTEEVFMNLVRQGYQPVYRSSSHSFRELTESAGGLEQIVDIVDSSGQFWTARYTLQKQPDGSWKITGCMLLKKPGEVA
jgi:hypothetical protein